MANIARLKEIKQRINAHPEKFNWKLYFEVPASCVFSQQDYNDQCKSLPEESCGTAACIAGWAIALYDPNLINRLSNVSEYNEATELLDLTNEEADFLLLDHCSIMHDVLPNDATYIERYEWPKNKEGHILHTFASRTQQELFIEANRKLDYIIAHHEKMERFRNAYLPS